MKTAPLLLVVLTLAAGAIILLAFQQWIDYGITETSGAEAKAATGISDGWFVAALGLAIVAVIGGVIFRPRFAPVLLPIIAICAVCILAIAGFDIVTNWHASGVQPQSPDILVQSDGDPTLVLYAIAALSILIAMVAAALRGIKLRQDPHLFGDLVRDEDVRTSPEVVENEG